MELSKAYEPQSVEDKWYDFWLKQNCFTADPKSPKPAYSIVIPPPNVTGVLTMGHVLNNTIQDILARKARMDGKEVLWLPGTDHAGIATQTVVERTLKKSGEIRHRDDLGREKFLERVWQWKEKHGGIIIQQLKKLGASCDWTRERFTMDPEYSRCVQRVFVDLYKKGLIYRGKRMVNWCPASLTALSDEEVVMKEQKGFLYYFKVEVAEAPGTFLTIATTRPETIPGDTAVAVNPKDPRYAKYIGKYVVRPLPVELPREQKLIPIIGDEHVDFAFGTGVLKVTPAHDKADFEIGQRHKLAQIEVIDAKGHMNDAAGADLRGLDRFKARKVAVEKLTELGALEKEEPYTNNVGYSERADVPIAPRLSEQWFLKYPSVEIARNAVEKIISVVSISGHELKGNDRGELRKSAFKFAQEKKWLGRAFKNKDTGWEILVRRRSLSHAFSGRNVAAIQAVAGLPQLIETAVLIRSEPHLPPAPDFKAVHHFVAALNLGGELFRIQITVKELANGQLLYDHKAKKITPGGKPLGPHPQGKLGIEPAPGAEIKLSDLLADVNVGKMRFYPERWAKVYDHWMGGLQDWCVSRQLWWGHRIPVWHKRLTVPNQPENHGKCWWFSETERALDEYGNKAVVRIIHTASGQTVGPFQTKSGMDNNLELNEQMDAGKSEHEFDVFVCTVDEQTVKYLVDELGFTQDPDVLDTWFSSWLWPFATMGWPEQTDTLKKFYPTTDLVTGPDIIFFWVARMIMAGYEFMGELPFRNVYFTGIIRDKQGRKMSKSLGNSPDPLDLIAKFGADALRFGVMRAAPLGQDILFDEQNVELGRNFCNKLWNACRFRQMQSSADVSPAPGEENQPEGRRDACPTFEVQGEIDPKLLTSDDKWILLKLDAAIRELNTAFAEYKFSDATATLYRFFWSEYCDWYVEASKSVLVSRSRGDETQTEKSGIDQSLLTSAPAKEEDARKANTVAVIDFVLSHTLRLFHPFLPFITEELWHGMGYATDMPENQGGKTIMFAPWPKPLDDDFKGHYGLDDCYLEIVNAKYDLISQGRNLRREANIPANKKVKFIFKPVNFTPPHDVEVLKLLLNAEAVEVNENFQPAKNVPAVRHELGELFLPTEGLVDVEAEKTRIKKEIAKYELEISKAEQKLNNPNFAQKVPPKVLLEHQQRLAEWQAKREQVKAALDTLG
jgi:valyl-tRNA synthetase